MLIPLILALALQGGEVNAAPFDIDPKIAQPSPCRK
jgi:hypothetical protein